MPQVRVRDGAHYAVVVVGGGQAGLATSWQLTARGIDHVVLEADRVANEWRDRRWDSFCLVTPNWQCDLPGFPYAGADRDGFMVRDEIVAYLEDYARCFDVPLAEGIRATNLEEYPQGFKLTTDAATITADQMVIATGPYQRPKIPRMAERLPGEVLQLHSSQYRNPGQLPAGEVVVVGTGQSGCQIAEDLHLAGRQVHLVTGSAPRVARFYRGRDVVAWLDEMGYYVKGIEEFDDVDAVRFRVNHYVTGRDGGRDIDLRRFALEGMNLYGRLVAIGGSDLHFATDLRTNLDHADAVSEGIKDSIDAFIGARGIQAPGESRYQPVWQPSVEPEKLPLQEISAVVWSTGFSRDDSWIRVPVFDGRGYPTHRRGVTSVPGLYFVGLPWQHTWGSGRFGGVAADAAYLGDQIVQRRMQTGVRWIAGLPRSEKTVA
ncbi:putative flavoprotein involved in K+ transport [Kribbella orskensis]|uniref:Flavoprotein involved in K+ transport n=1 Tax=Kribbella orskensis TaxID=2512216 RepID=A0ABY2BJ52_9ACTN|nr:MULTISPECIES: MSMEG_0569 family flavin-dependent oxidoreductase [Kribbella]TCN38886.1 putative flavoprotein involved in K+ transport [Kribbella sp. VKM Ac-2500]TCO21067.1 putative flavoprotein involved in K+ transport [Kribbella orskensis]